MSPAYSNNASLTAVSCIFTGAVIAAFRFSLSPFRPELHLLGGIST